MVPVDNTTTMHEEESNTVSNEAGASCSSISHKNSGDRNGAHSGTEIRVKVVAEINADCSTSSNITTNVHTMENSHKRDFTLVEETPTKRCRLAEDIDAKIDGVEINISKKANKDADDVNPEGCGSTIQIKTEPSSQDHTNDNDKLPSSSGCSDPVDIKPTIEKVEATSTTRQSCRFGISCYRRNPMHRIEEAHPGDNDYSRPNYPPPPQGTPDCPYGDRCYRRNPIHFEQFSHPPETNFEQNYKYYQLRMRQRRQRDQYNTIDRISDFEDELESDDPFSNDELDSDYTPDINEDDDDDYDDGDRAEE